MCEIFSQPFSSCCKHVPVPTCLGVPQKRQRNVMKETFLVSLPILLIEAYKKTEKYLELARWVPNSPWHLELVITKSKLFPFFALRITFQIWDLSPGLNEKPIHFGTKSKIGHFLFGWLPYQKTNKQTHWQKLASSKLLSEMFQKRKNKPHAGLTYSSSKII